MASDWRSLGVLGPFRRDRPLVTFDPRAVPTEELLTPQAVADWTVETGEIDFQVTRTGPVMQLGSFVVYPWSVTATTGEAEGVSVLQLDAQNKIANYWSIG